MLNFLSRISGPAPRLTAPSLALRHDAQKRGTTENRQKPFAAILWVSESHPAKLGRQPEASLACFWGDPRA
jgi:hypothetical protein